MLIFNQRDPLWNLHVLGWGPHVGTIGDFGCYNTVLAIIARACGYAVDPGSLDVVMTSHKIFAVDPSGTFDYLPNDALDRTFLGSFKSARYAGFRGDLVLAARSTKNTFVVCHVSGYSPFWKMKIATHYVLMYGRGPSIADPEGGKIRMLADYGGPANVLETIVIQYLPPTGVPLPPVPPPIPPVPFPVPVPLPVPVPSPDPLPPAPIPTPTPLPPPPGGWPAFLSWLGTLLRRLIATG